jgi:hypothetical protein
MDDPNFIAGAQQATIVSLSKDMAEVKAAVLRIEITLAERRGERRTVLWLAASVGSLASGIVALIARRFNI